MRFLPWLLLSLFLMPLAANAQLCSEPIEPWCVGQETTYDSPEAITDCYEELEIYLREVDEFAQCLREKAAAVTKEAEKARQEFCSRPNVEDCS